MSHKVKYHVSVAKWTCKHVLLARCFAKVKKTAVFTSIIVSCLIINANAQAAKKTIGSFSYTYQKLSKDNIWITGIEIISEQNIGVLRIPSKIDGRKVTKIGKITDEETDFIESDNIFGISRSTDNEMLTPKNIVKQTKNIQKIILPDTLTDMTPNCFLHLQKGKGIYIPKGITKNIQYLCEGKWKNFEISRENKKFRVKNSMILSKEGKKTYGYVGSGSQAIIPKGVKTLGERTFYGAKVKSISIPKSVNKIEKDVFSYLKSVKFWIDRANKNYGVTGGCLYSKRSGRLIAGVTKKGIVKIPEEVTCVNSQTVILGKDISQIIFPQKMKTIGFGWDNSLNNGNHNSAGCFGGDTLELVFKGKLPPKLEKGVLFLFQSVSHVKIIVPKGTKIIYQLAFWDAIKGSPVMEDIKVAIEEG